MSISRLINRPCELVLREDGARNAHGNPATEETRHEAVCEIQKLRGTEPPDAGETADTRWSVWFLPTVEDGLPRPLEVRDAVEVDGVLYEFADEPERLRDPFRRVQHHVRVTARRVAGPGGAGS